jgi:hypothetical protein
MTLCCFDIPLKKIIIDNIFCKKAPNLFRYYKACLVGGGAISKCDGELLEGVATSKTEGG